MVRRKNTINVKGAAQFATAQQQLAKEGYAVCMPNHFVHQDGNDFHDYGDYVHRQLLSYDYSKENGNGGESSHGMPFLMQSSGSEQMMPDTIGSPGKGYITWGAANRVPNTVALLTGMLPYTASGHKFNTDLLSSIGPEPMYHSVRYQLGGGLIREDIPYGDAGVFLKGLIHDLRLQRDKLTMQSQYDDAFPQMVIDKQSIDDIDEQIKELQKDYEKWQHDWPEIRAFCEATGNSQTFIQLASDEQLLNMCFPELDLNQTSTETDGDGRVHVTPTWQPKVQAIRYRPAHICRLERMDDKGRINYVYMSNRFYDDPVAMQDIKQQEITALPALSRETPLADLKRLVREARQKRVAKKRRPTRVIMPVAYPTPGRPYYPVPAWHSVFTGNIYEYASTIIADRYTRKKNANVIGRVIYIHKNYLDSLYAQQTNYAQQMKTLGKEYKVRTKEQLRDEMYSDINNWLNRRTNAGQSLIAFTFTGPDGKDRESFKVVEIEGTSSSNANANQTELLEISSIIFFAMGLDSTLVGNTPGKTGTNSGTDLRTRYLMKQIQMSPTQKLLLRPWEVASQFNEWDEHLVWQVKREVITTLDNSKTGITAVRDDNGSTDNQSSQD